MAILTRNSNSRNIVRPSRTFFVTTKTSMGRALRQSERNAKLFIDVLRSYVAAKKFQVHDFVVMPDHVHIRMTVNADTSIEKAMQYIKGGFSYRMKKEFGFSGEVWQRGFSQVRVDDRESFAIHHLYIAENPVKRGLVNAPQDYPFCFDYLAQQKKAGAKARQQTETIGTTEVRALIRDLLET